MLFPYRAAAASPADPLFDYDKIPVERTLLGRPGLDAAIVRLAKIYGPEKNADFATVHFFAISREKSTRAPVPFFE